MRVFVKHRFSSQMIPPTLFTVDWCTGFQSAATEQELVPNLFDSDQFRWSYYSHEVSSIEHQLFTPKSGACGKMDKL